MTRPTIHVDHPATMAAAVRRGIGPTAGLYCGMAGFHRHGCISVLDAVAPDLQAMRGIRAGDLSLQGYAEHCLSRWRRFDLSPGSHALRTLGNGAGLFCECSRPGSKSRRHPCHRELWPLVLVPAGWDVVLYGRPVTTAEAAAVLLDDEPEPGATYPRWADTGAPFDPAAFGWPRGLR